jgi:hypothetical protein
MVISPLGLKVQLTDWKTWIYGTGKANSFKISATSMNIFSASPSTLFENTGILVFYEPKALEDDDANFRRFILLIH